MAAVYEFGHKTMLTRMEETSDVLQGRGEAIPASAIRKEWSIYMEVAIEPVGWQAAWRISRAQCEEFGLGFPTLVMGTVEQVDFEELNATFVVEAVQDDDVHLAEQQIVALEELYPLHNQENPALNVERTADCIDKLRFFYQHIWMPWDNDSDDDRVDWASKHLESRIKLYCDLKNKTMSKQLSSHLLALLAEASYIQKRKEILETEIDLHDEDEDDSHGNITQHDNAGQLMKLHLRMNTIKNEVEILENPAMREAYETARFSVDTNYFPGTAAGAKVEHLLVSHVGTLDEQIEYLAKAKEIIGPHKPVRICDSLQVILNRCQASDQVFLPPGRHNIKFLEYLNGGGSIRAISSINFVEASEQNKLEELEGMAIVCSQDDDSVLLNINGDFLFENIMFDCRNVRTGVLVKRGNVTFRNCYFIGDPRSSTKQGIVIFGNSNVALEDCVVKDFATGIYSNRNSSIELNKSVIDSCNSGIEVLHSGSITFTSSRISNCKSYGVILDSDDPNVTQNGTLGLTFEDHDSIKHLEFKLMGNCDFSGNGKANYIVYNGDETNFNNSCFVASPQGPPDQSELMEDALLEEESGGPSNVSADNDVTQTDALDETNDLNGSLPALVIPTNLEFDWSVPPVPLFRRSFRGRPPLRANFNLPDMDGLEVTHVPNRGKIVEYTPKVQTREVDGVIEIDDTIVIDLDESREDQEEDSGAQY